MSSVKSKPMSASPSSGSKTKTGTKGVTNRSSSVPSPQCPSPTKSETKKIPPIKAPVGLARGPDLKNIKSKIGSFDNVKHRPSGGEKKVETQKLEWNAKSRIGSLDNSKHKPLGGEVKVKTQKLEWKASSKVGSLDNIKHQPGGGEVKIFDEKYSKEGIKSPSPGTTPTPGDDEPKSGTFFPNGNKNGGAVNTPPKSADTSVTNTPVSTRPSTAASLIDTGAKTSAPASAGDTPSNGMKTENIIPNSASSNAPAV